MSKFSDRVGVKYPIICGAMYPCSNPELVAAASEAGGIGIVQPVSLSFVHGHDFREGLRYIRTLTRKPIGLNLLVEQSSKVYQDRNKKWLEIALDEGVRFFVTALGNPNWVVELVHAQGGLVFHDVTNRTWAEKALKSNVDGFICVNNRAGGHAGQLSPEQLMSDLKSFGKPLICAGGVSTSTDYRAAMQMGYAGVQLGTRFIASAECQAHDDYKRAIVDAKPEDIVLTDKISGVPVAVINTPYIQSIGTKAGPVQRWLLRGRKTKHWMRMIYMLKATWQLKHSHLKGSNYKDYFQAGKSVGGIHKVETVKDIIQGLVK